MIIINNNTQKSGGVTPEQVIKASQGYPYNIDTTPSLKNSIFEGDLMVTYQNVNKTNYMRLFDEGSFLANHVKKVNIMGQDVEDMESFSNILSMIMNTYSLPLFGLTVIYTLDTDTIEGDLFGIDYIEDAGVSPTPDYIYVNSKVKSLDCSHMSVRANVSMLNSPTEILEQGSIKGKFTILVLPLSLKNLEQDAFAKFVDPEGGDETDCEVSFLFMPSLTVPESLPQSLYIHQITGHSAVFFPALIGERTYKDYVKDVFNIDVTTEDGAAKVSCYNITTGRTEGFVKEE